MSIPENFAEESADLEREIERKGVILDIDWNDDAQVQALARQAFHCHLGATGCDIDDPGQRARVELFAIAQLMLEVMTKSADNGLQVHGGPAWKAFARALWREKEGANATTAAPADNQPET
ncbi:MAG: hypothetical protein CVU17_03240 [Betaproteobacteria bacterium HGW-Betaproteobacteria-11]|nr:MAG: hypothetical protein CVU17_03240 [Betaproteobacteria bacterium HGW-Betaproteobacteria-11]